MRKIKLARIVASGLFLAGVLLGLFMSAGLNLASLEGFVYFGTDRTSQEKLKTLRCPTILSSNESSLVTATITNTTDQVILPIFKIQISDQTDLWSTVSQKASIAPGETRQLQWKIDSRNVAFGYLVLVHVSQSTAYLTPSREDTCGTWVLNIPYLNGLQILWIGCLGALLLMAAGIVTWTVGNQPLVGRPRFIRQAMLFLALAVLGGIAAGIFDLWLVGVVCLMLSVLTLIAIFSFFSSLPPLSE